MLTYSSQAACLPRHHRPLLASPECGPFLPSQGCLESTLNSWKYDVSTESLVQIFTTFNPAPVIRWRQVCTYGSMYTAV